MYAYKTTCLELKLEELEELEDIGKLYFKLLLYNKGINDIIKSVAMETVFKFSFRKVLSAE